MTAVLTVDTSTIADKLMQPVGNSNISWGLLIIILLFAYLITRG